MKWSVFIFCFLCSVSVFSQQDFPQSWVGNYRGELEIYTVDSVAMRLPMQLAIQPTKRDSVYTWAIIYDIKNNRDVRSYELKIVDSAKGHYMIDEKNGILIDSYYRNGILTGFFDVNQTFIIATYQKQGDSIVFEIISASDKPVRMSGDLQVSKDTIPEVKSFEVNGRQKAVLHHVNMHK